MSKDEEEMPPIDEANPSRRLAMDEIDEIMPVPPVASPMPPPRAPRRSNTYTPYAYSSRSTDQNRTMSPEAELLQARIDREIIRQQLQIQEEPWIKSYWRPAMGWLYMLICLVDFVIFPALVMILPAILKNFGIQIDYQPWQSLTLTNGGLMHIAFGAILGITAWTRGKDNMTR